MELAFPEVVWLGMVPEPCELQLETCLPVTQEYQDEGAVFGDFTAVFVQPEGFPVEFYAFSRSVTLKLKWSKRPCISILLVLY